MKVSTMRTIVKAAKKTVEEATPPQELQTGEFSEAYRLAIPVPYDEKWLESGGYLGGATRWAPEEIDLMALQLSVEGTNVSHPGKEEGVEKESHRNVMFRSVDPTGRRILLLPIADGKAGTVVIFDRYTPGHGPQVFVQCAPRSVAGFLNGLAHGSLDEDQLHYIIGSPYVKNGEVRSIAGIAQRFDMVHSVVLKDTDVETESPTSH